MKQVWYLEHAERKVENHVRFSLCDSIRSQAALNCFRRRCQPSLAAPSWALEPFWIGTHQSLLCQMRGWEQGWQPRVWRANRKRSQDSSQPTELMNDQWVISTGLPEDCSALPDLFYSLSTLYWYVNFNWVDLKKNVMLSMQMFEVTEFPEEMEAKSWNKLISLNPTVKIVGTKQKVRSTFINRAFWTYRH